MGLVQGRLAGPVPAGKASPEEQDLQMAAAAEAARRRLEPIQPEAGAQVKAAREAQERPFLASPLQGVAAGVVPVLAARAGQEEAGQDQTTPEQQGLRR